MNNVDVMTSAASFSDVKRKLLEKYSRGKLAQVAEQSQAITRRPSGEFAPLSLAQQQLWLREQGMPPLYNESVTIRRSGPLDLAVLERSLAEIIRRHEIWRTSYDLVDGALVQIIHPSPPSFTLPMVDLRRFPEDKIAEEAQRLANEQARRPFDLRRGPLWRAMLLRTGDADYRLSMVAHLSIVDGVSVYSVLPSELTAIYGAYCAGEVSPLQELPIQYADYACWQRKWLNDSEKERQLTYWRKQLAGELPALQWPNERQGANVQSYRGAIQPFALSQPLTDALKELGRSEGVTLFTSLVASFTSLLYCYTRHLDLIIGTLSPAGRKRSEVQPLLGHFLNPVCLRMNLEGDPSFRELLFRASRVIAGAISYDDLPIEILVKEMQPTPDRTPTPFFTVAVSLQPQTPSAAQAWEVTSMDAESGGAMWGAYVAFIDRSTGLIGRVQYNPDIFEPAIITTMLQHLQILIAAVAADPDQPISELSKSVPVQSAARK